MFRAKGGASRRHRTCAEAWSSLSSREIDVYVGIPFCRTLFVLFPLRRWISSMAENLPMGMSKR